MLQILFAVAFSVAPLTLYVPPVRSLNLFVQSIEVMVRETEPISRRAFFRFRLGIRRIFSRISRAFRWTRSLHAVDRRKGPYRVTV